MFLFREYTFEVVPGLQLISLEDPVERTNPTLARRNWAGQSIIG